jgi:hypothetical protein
MPWQAEHAGTLDSGNPSSKIRLPVAMEPRGAPPKGLGLRFLKWVAKAVSDIEHDRVRSPAFAERPQLVLDVLGLLSRQSRHREIAEITLSGQTVAGLAIFQLGLETALPCTRTSVLRVTGCRKSHGQ